MKRETHILRYGQRVEGSIYNLSRYTNVRESRIPAGHSAYVWLGDHHVGFIRRERTRHRGRECWRWCGYSEKNALIPDAQSTDRAATARAVATAWLELRAGLPDYENRASNEGEPTP